MKIFKEVRADLRNNPDSLSDYTGTSLTTSSRFVQIDGEW